MKIALVGSSGFVGQAVADALLSLGHEVVPVRAPRIPHRDSADHLDIDDGDPLRLAAHFKDTEAVVNCAGDPDASKRDVNALLAANALSAAVVARAAVLAKVPRLVHVSSAVVQGRRSILDETDNTEEFSAYAFSKAEGERRVLAEFPEAVVYRPPSVHAASRRVTAMTARIAASPLSSVAAPGHQPSPQALIDNVSSAIAFLATTEKTPPSIVIHPWEGLTVSDVMNLLGGKPPRVLHRGLAEFVCGILKFAGERVPKIAANSRRVEMLWFGQTQGESWLTLAGWAPPSTRQAWVALGNEVRLSR